MGNQQIWLAQSRRGHKEVLFFRESQKFWCAAKRLQSAWENDYLLKVLASFSNLVYT